MSTRNSSARNQKTGFHDGNEAWAGLIILIFVRHFGFQIQSHFSGKLSTALWTWRISSH